MNKLLKNLPNMLTALRILLTLVFVYFIYNKFSLASSFSYLLIFITYAAICVTDILDGFLARTMGSVSKFGGNFDVLVDVFFVITSFVTLNKLNMLPIWFTILAFFKFTEFSVTSHILKNRENKISMYFIFDKIGKFSGIMFFTVPCIILIGYKFKLFSNLSIIIIYIITCLALVSSTTRIIRCFRCKKKENFNLAAKHK